jgi:hypothetical protein
MSSTLGASLLRTVLSDGTLKILGSGLDKGPIIQRPTILSDLRSHPLDEWLTITVVDFTGLL